MLLNLSNHPSSKWSEKQLSAAKEEYEEITDMSFPAVSTNDSHEHVQSTAENLVRTIVDMNPDAVMCQGEFTLTYAIVSLLKERGIKVISACSERNSRERVTPDGKTEKIVTFDFVRFREY